LYKKLLENTVQYVMCPDPTTLVHSNEPDKKNKTIATMETIQLHKPDLIECDASDLAHYLLQHRFQNDAMATASFLLECTSTLPNAEEISAQLLGGDGDEDDDNGGVDEVEGEDSENEVEQVEAEVEEEEEERKDVFDNMGDALIEPTVVSFINPRGKLTMTLYENGLHCKNAKDDVLVIPAESVERVVTFPKPEDCRRTTSKNKNSKIAGDMVLLCLKESKDDDTQPQQHNIITFKNKTMKQVCFQLPNDPPKVLAQSTKEQDEEMNSNSGSDWMELLVTACDLDPQRDVARVYNPTIPRTQRSGYTFESFNESSTSTTTGGMPFVKCYKGVQDGALFPMEEGLLFFKPPLYLHRSKMHSIACGRGSGGSRYVDMVVTYDKDDTKNKKGGDDGDDDSNEELEFSNIHRDELRVLNDYIHKILIPAMTREVNNNHNDNKNAQNNTENSNNDDDEHTDDGDTEVTSTASPIAGKRSSKRKASKAAREATRAELGSPSQDADSDGDEDDDEEEKWESSDEDSISHDDMSLSGVNEEPIDEDSDDEEDEEYAEAEAASETESDEDDDDDQDEPAAKKSRKK